MNYMTKSGVFVFTLITKVTSYSFRVLEEIRGQAGELVLGKISESNTAP